jgi:superfamily I DNA/RNA helicase
MASKAELILAVAGSRKTQGIVEECASAPVDKRILILTYTSNNQNELKARISKYAGSHHCIEIQGWFSFLIQFIVRPYLPFAFKGHKLRGFDFYTEPKRFIKLESSQRYLSDDGKAYRVHLPQLAFKVHEACGGCWLNRLSRLFDVIYIDEVQDLCGYDLEILNLLLTSGIQLKLVGDVRQAVIATNAREPKNKQFKFMGIWGWFQARTIEGKLIVTQRSETWRCRPEIADFADALFDPSEGFEKTRSLNCEVTDHDGIVLVKPSDLDEYVKRYQPLILRHSKSSGKGLSHDFVNYKESKGLSVKRVCILPTEHVLKYLNGKMKLSRQQAAELYVAVTRAEQSVAFILENPKGCNIAVWNPNGSVATEVDQLALDWGE